MPKAFYDFVFSANARNANASKMKLANWLTVEQLQKIADKHTVKLSADLKGKLEAVSA